MSNEKILVLGIGTTGNEVINDLSGSYAIRNVEILTVNEDFDFVKNFLFPKAEAADLILFVVDVFRTIQQYIILDIVTEAVNRKKTLSFGVFTEHTDRAFAEKFLAHADGFIENNSTYEVITGILDLINKGRFSIAEIKNIVKISGKIYFGSAWVRGKNRVKIAAYEALKFLPMPRKNLTKMLINITTGKDITSDEAASAVKVIRENVDDNVCVHWGHIVDENFDDMFQMKIFAAL